MEEGARTRAEMLRGIAGAPGVAIGAAVVMGSARNTYPRRHIHDEDAPHDPEYGLGGVRVEVI